ncbi:MAG: redoxin domain-containing protein [Candidatus Parvarchaeota archaeon]|jgi:thiol-disulfide isomerase/thioredoxin|nr:redoxin domain-containing protein [Candidatus Parvarchaeota archaeon]MCL5420393.1 redoxin domain-containing protein [Candidatus Parvarchaeota archaeon]
MRVKIKYLVYVIIVAIVLVIIINFFIINHSKSSKYLITGETAPNYTFQAVNGSTLSVNNYHGKPLLLWFVATWCSSCAQGNQVLASDLNFFEQHNVKIVELEQYNDLGQPGMPISKFISEYGNNNSYVQGGVAGYNMTLAYNTPPTFQLDIYYLISPSGKILYVGEGLANGIPTLENMITNEGL